MRRGYTLLEMATALMIVGLGVSVLLPSAREWRDRAAVVGARETAAGLLVRARSEAVLHGRSFYVVDVRSSRVRVEAGARVRAMADLGRDRGIRVSTSGSEGEVRLRFDGLGIGRAASRTLVFERGEARSRLVISAYGRVRRR